MDNGEALQNAIQRAAEAEKRLARIAKAADEDGLNEIALGAAQAVEDLFAQHHNGGRSQRLARAQIIIREAMRANLIGKTDWRYPNNLQHNIEPVRG